MSCTNLSASVQAYVDRELTGFDREAVERHLVSCPSCARQVHLEGRFKAAVRAHLPRPEVPLALKLRVKEALATQEIAPRRWPWLSYPRLVPAAAAFLLIVGITSTVRQSQSMVLEQAQRSYQAEMPMDITGSDCGLDRLLVPRSGRLSGARPGARRRCDLSGGAAGQRGRAPGRLPALPRPHRPSGGAAGLRSARPVLRRAGAPGDQRPRDLPREPVPASRPPPTATGASAMS